MTVADQVRALTEGAGLLPRSDLRVVKVSGADAVDFLHRMVSQEIKGLAPGRAAYACVLDAKAHLLGLPVIWRYDEFLLLDLAADAAEKVVPRLERYVITEDVVFEDVTGETLRFALIGPGARKVWPNREPGAHADGILRLDLGTTPAFEGLGPFEVIAGLAGVTRVEAEAFDVLRVQERIPAWGAELDPYITPLEARLGDLAISWTKGCYPGQEPVSMAHHRGHPPSLLVRLDLSEWVKPGTLLLVEGRKAGRVTTAVLDPRDGRVKGLGYVRYALAEGTAALEIDGGGEARVVN